MRPLTGAQVVTTGPAQVELCLDGGYRLFLFALAPRLARYLILRPDGLDMPRTWSLSPELSGQADPALAEPLDGRDRMDLTGFPGTALTVVETETTIVIETALWRVEARRSPLALSWYERTGDGWRLVQQDRQTQAYLFDAHSRRFAHYLASHPAERYYGFGEKSGDADKRGRRLVMGTIDAMGYDPETTDPLYKHIPFRLTVRPDQAGATTGLFYDNLARAVFDLGQTVDAYHGDFTSFEADSGDLDAYVLFGPALPDVVAGFTALTGRNAFPPRWALSYSGSTMQYTDAPDAADRLLGFLDLLHTHDLPCQSFQMSSGYTTIGERRYVFNWNRDKFPDPEGVARRFNEAGVRLVANIKPALLEDHPRFAEVEAFRGFIRDSLDPSRPHLTQFWGGNGAYLDFTNPKTTAWWMENVRRELLDRGIGSTWNDNNEFEIWDDHAGCDLGGRGARIATLRPVQTHLMIRASYLAQIAHAPSKRPYLITRSGGPGLQRYVQTWTGDNRTSWKSLRYNLRMGHGDSLSGLFDFGHDVGGFAGPKPDPELFMRWVEQGIYWPRFTIHSWNDDGSVTEPWMYPEILPQVRAALNWRERLVPFFYTLLWKAHHDHAPILRPLFFDFPDQEPAYTEDDSFMLGDRLLVAPVVDPAKTERAVWLPAVAGGWYDIRDGRHYVGGGVVTVPAPLGSCPVLARAGTVLPLGPAPSTAEGPLTLRLFPADGGLAPTVVFDDDGESVLDAPDAWCALHFTADATGALVVARTGGRVPRWSKLVFEDHTGAPVAVRVAGHPDPVRDLTLTAGA